MSKLPRISGRIAVRALAKVGFYLKRHPGSHLILRRDEPFGQVVVPDHQEVAKGTLRAIIQQAPVGSLGGKTERNCSCLSPTYNLFFALSGLTHCPISQMATIDQIRRKIQERDYYLSSHAEDEMVDDYLERQDIEQAILQGRIEKTMTHDNRGTRYRIEGSTMDGRLIHLICRFRGEGSLIIVTVYVLPEDT